jgi:hypothetical protein
VSTHEQPKVPYEITAIDSRDKSRRGTRISACSNRFHVHLSTLTLTDWKAALELVETVGIDMIDTSQSYLVASAAPGRIVKSQIDYWFDLGVAPEPPGADGEDEHSSCF